MIIRRKHTANFTTIGNRLFNDERLAADEVGVLATLLSKPHDWQVKRPQLQKRWKIGRDSVKRIIHNLMRYGWIVAQKTRLENGTIYTTYEVRDEPGPELSDEEIKAALSLVSSGAGPDDASDDDGAEGEGPELVAQPPTENPSWSAGQPSLAEPHPANPSWPIEDSQNTESQRKESPKAMVDFARLRGKWPPENVLSETAAQQVFLGMADAEQADAYDRAGAYLDDCKAQNRKVCDLTTYLREKRWVRFTRRQPKPAAVLVLADTPQFYRWVEYRKATGDWSEAKERFWKQQGAMAVPSEWPPADSIAKTG